MDNKTTMTIKRAIKILENHRGLKFLGLEGDNYKFDQITCDAWTLKFYANNIAFNEGL